MLITCSVFVTSFWQHPWTEVFDNNDANGAVNAFISQFKSIYNNSFSFKLLKQPLKIRKPWITQDVLNKIQTKNTMYQKILSQPDPNLLREFKIFRNRLNKEIYQAKTRYFHSVFTESSNTAVIWKKIISVIGTQKTTSPIKGLTINGNKVGGTELSNAFNEFLVNLHPPSLTGDYQKYLETTSAGTIYLGLVSEYEVFSILMLLKNSHCFDVFHFKVHPVKFVADVITAPLTHVFNLCIVNGSFPTELQTAKVSVIYKKGDRNAYPNIGPFQYCAFFLNLLKSSFTRV